MAHVDKCTQAEYANLGHIVILPSSFEGRERSIYQHYQDAIKIVTKYGNADIFLTFTANHRWPKILGNLLPHQSSSDRPDLVNRVFHLKFKEILHDLLFEDILGHVAAFVHTIGFQKKGLLNAHMVFFLTDADKSRTTEDVDQLMSVEILNPQLHPVFTNTVKTDIAWPIWRAGPSACLYAE